MGGGLLQGAALGAAFDLLFISVVDATRGLACFSSDLNRLKSTLCSIKLAIDDVESFNKILERPQRQTEAFTRRLTEGEKLIRRCSKVSKFNVIMRLYYSKKLGKLEALLVKIFQIDVAALHFRETKRVSVVVSSLEERMNEITTMLNTSKTANNFSENAVGSDQSCEGIVVIEEGGSLVELSAP